MINDVGVIHMMGGEGIRGGWQNWGEIREEGSRGGLVGEGDKGEKDRDRGRGHTTGGLSGAIAVLLLV